MPFRCANLGLQTKLKLRQQIHLRTKCPAASLSVKRPAENELRRPIMVTSEPMVDERRLPNTSPGNDRNDIDILVCPRVIQEGHILLSTKKILMPRKTGLHVT